MAFEGRAAFGISLALVVVALASFAAAAGRGKVQPEPVDPTSKKICTLSEEHTDAAISVFDKLTKQVFQHDRCANCHTKIDPFSTRVHPDIKEAFRRYRNEGSLEKEGANSSQPYAEGYAAIRQFLDGKPLTDEMRRVIMHSNACAVCHDPPSDESWHMAPKEDSFHDKSAPALCKRIHTSSLTAPAEEFEKHMGHDQFIDIGFAGTRGLNGVSEAAYDDMPVSHGAVSRIPVSKPTMMNWVREWLKAQDNKYSPNLECGCRPFHYALKVQGSWTGLGQRYSGGGKSETKLKLKFGEGGNFTADGSLDVDVGHELEGCSWSQKTGLVWKLHGAVPPAGKGNIHVTGVVEVSPGPATIKCPDPDDGPNISAPAPAGHSEPLAFDLEPEVGATYLHKRGASGGDVSIDDAWALTLIEEP